eukprot:Nitzschia sp. Nitz4//scaffold50_size126154//80078//82475//NITZ4_003690-RA/size126154-augustus-gene-0.7-mRNA-1//1//CDS//3329553713//3351//frame0
MNSATDLPSKEAQDSPSQAAFDSQTGTATKQTTPEKEETTTSNTKDKGTTMPQSPEASATVTGTPKATASDKASGSAVQQRPVYDYYHSYRGPVVPSSYDPTRPAATTEPKSQQQRGGPPPPPPGPYTAAQLDGRNGPPQVTRMIYPAPPAPASSHLPRQPNSPSSLKDPTPRDPPPSMHMYHPPPHMHPHQHPSYPPYREDPRGGSAHRPSWTTHPPRYYEASSANSQLPQHSHPYPPPPAYAAAPSCDSVPPQGRVPVGPYRFSDPTLRREALTAFPPPGRAPNSPSSNNANASSSKDKDGDVREAATSPTQIESHHREEVTTMGCTCKKTKCLKLYCQCFAVKIYCGSNCSCMVCRNKSEHEKERQEAIRNILSRNPQAFDTKFKKGHSSDVQSDLAHKVGCKCRRSACMKKYCECFAGNVKCTANCRCVGCKNVPRGNFFGGAGGSSAMGMPSALPSFLVASAPIPESMTVSSVNAARDATSRTSFPDVGNRKSEPYVMNAAHNLAFLKHASPMADRSSFRRTPSHEGDGGSMPSLASEESPVDTSGKRASTPAETGEPKKGGDVSALLMAAVAMAEMSGKASTENPDMDQTTTAHTPPQTKKTEEEETKFETPQRNLMRQFQSPKRKKFESEPNADNSEHSSPQSATNDEAKESPSREGTGSDNMVDQTPSDEHKIKRSRLGSLRKKTGTIPEETTSRTVTFDATNENDDELESMQMETPKHSGTNGRTDELTPVSARCLDFKRMSVRSTPEVKSMTDSPAAKR